MNVEKHISLLQVIKKNPDSGQRDLAEAVGLSLGMTNILLKELAAKGWVMIRKINSRNFNYLLTPDGVKELSKRSYRYLKKTIRSLADCRTQLEQFVVSVKADGYRGLALVGRSELEFLVDFLCQKHQLEFTMVAQRCEVQAAFFAFYSEEESQEAPNLLEYMAPGDLSGI